MDPATLTCSKCSRLIKKTRKGTFPNFCGHCRTPVVVPERLEVILCPGCGEEIERDSGIFPNYCLECGFDIHVTICSNIDCGEKIERVETGKFPTFCEICGEPVVTLQSSSAASSSKEIRSKKIDLKEAGKTQSVSQEFSSITRNDYKPLKCPNPQCQLPIKLNKKGIFSKFCRECSQPLPDYLRLQFVHCPTLDCGERIERNTKQEFPKYCDECDEPFQKCLNPICSYTTNATKGGVPQHCPLCKTSLTELANQGM